MLENQHNPQLGEHYRELQRSENKQGIIQIGPKIAALYLRDVVSLFHLDERVPDELAFCLQAVDVWVRKLAYRTGITEDGTSDKEIQKAIVALCQEHDCSPIQFNQGAWYIGRFAFDLLLEMLSETAGE